MNPSTACARVLVDELIRLGCRHAVLCPGSRSAPLAYALARADAEGRLTLHVRVDERSAAYLAVGLGKLERVPAVVVTTSGTAVANLHPAVLEADADAIPLLVLSADRPPELRGTGANQTTDQVKIFGPAARWAADLGTPAETVGAQATWRTAVDRAWAAAVGSLGALPGPAHLNVPFRDPLVEEDGSWVEPLDGREQGRPWTEAAAPTGTPWHGCGESPAGVEMAPVGVETVPDVPRTVVVLGDLDAPEASRRVLLAARELGWSVVAEPLGGRPDGTGDALIPHGRLLATVPDFVARHRPDRILVVGRLTLSRPMAALLRTPGVRIESVTAGPAWTDPGHLVHRVFSWSSWTARQCAGRTAPRTPQDESWTEAWRDAGRRLGSAVGPVLDAAESWPSGPAVAATMLRALPTGAHLFAGSSNSVRDLDIARGSEDVAVFASRGLAGIDGNIATAMGLALAGGSPTYALVGDLTFLHDANALAVGPDEPRADLTVVVTDDDGGGIFTSLEYGEPGRERFFERLFATSVTSDVAQVAVAHGVEVVEARTRAELARAVTQPPRGIRVVRVCVDRSTHRGMADRLHDAAREALA